MGTSAENVVREAGAPGNAPLAGRTFVVTGAGRGLCVAFAMVFADAGADLLLTGRDLGHLEAVRVTVGRRSGRTATITALDLADPLNAAKKMRSLAHTSPGIDGLINSGAAWQSGALLDHENAEIAGVIASHIAGTLLVTRSLAPALLTAPRGDVVNIVSISGLPNTPLSGASPAFHAGKHGQAELSDALRQSFARSSFRVTALYPPDLDTMTPEDDAWHLTPTQAVSSLTTTAQPPNRPVKLSYMFHSRGTKRPSAANRVLASGSSCNTSPRRRITRPNELWVQYQRRIAKGASPLRWAAVCEKASVRSCEPCLITKARSRLGMLSVGPSSR
ncbi:MAG: hypothetical protein CMM46_01910 [Rhodospirillaceae bacterium]|nr:hypothetical protein [Rhodospirillaceae bacterium]